MHIVDLVKQNIVPDSETITFLDNNGVKGVLVNGYNTGRIVASWYSKT